MSDAVRSLKAELREANEEVDRQMKRVRDLSAENEGLRNLIVALKHQIAMVRVAVEPTYVEQRKP